MHLCGFNTPTCFPMIYLLREALLQHSRGAVLCVPAAISRSQLDTAAVLKQVDKKFLVAASGKVVLV